MVEDTLEGEFRQICQHYQQALLAGQTPLAPPKAWELKTGSWFVYSLNNTRNIFDSISSQVADLLISLNREAEGDSIKERNLKKKIKASNGACLEVLLLLFFRGNLEMLRQYSTYILNDALKLSGMALPLERHVFSSVFDMNEKVDELYEAQYLLFCPIIKEGEFDIVVDRRSRMPYEEERFLEEGASGKVYAVRVAAKHYQMLEANIPDSEAVELARKDFYVDPKNLKENNVSAYQNEVNVYKAILEVKTSHENIATAIGSIIYGSNSSGDSRTVRSMFFKLARFNLHEYLQNQDIFPGSRRLPETLHDIQQMTAICSALEWLSGLLSYHRPSDSMKLYQYYHGDLKPANILVYGNPDQYNSIVFKISDFGETQKWNLSIKTEKSRWLSFSRFHQTSAVNRDGTYIAPEEAHGERSDIWSFGCIFLLVIAANIDGYHAIENFSKDRGSRNSKCWNRNSDSFYEEDEKTRKRKVNEAVTNYTMDLIKFCNKTGDGMTEKCLTLIRDEMILSKPRDRTSAKDLHMKLIASYKERPAVRFISIDHDRELFPGEKVCCAAISPSGKLESFLCRNAIYVWNTQISQYIYEPILLYTSSANDGGFKPILLCGEDKICKINSVNGSLQLELYILEWSMYKAERSLKFVRRFQMSPDILHTATLSADGNYLAIACQSSTGSDSSGMNSSNKTSIRLFDIAGLCLDPDERPSLDRTGTSMGSSRGSDADHKLPNCLEGSRFKDAILTEHLEFSTDSSYLYRIDQKSRDGSIDRSHLFFEVWKKNGATWSWFKDFKIEVKTQAPRTGDKRLASMTPLHRQVGFIGSWSPDSILLCVPENHTGIKERLVKDRGRIVHVLIAQDDERVVILADRGGSLAILGVKRNEIESDKPGDEGISPVELDIRGTLEYLPTEGDRARLLEMGGDVLILLLSRPEKRKSFSINVSRLFHSV